MYWSSTLLTCQLDYLVSQFWINAKTRNLNQFIQNWPDSANQPTLFGLQHNAEHAGNFQSFPSSYIPAKAFINNEQICANFFGQGNSLSLSNIQF